MPRRDDDPLCIGCKLVFAPVAPRERNKLDDLPSVAGEDAPGRHAEVANGFVNMLAVELLANRGFPTLPVCASDDKNAGEQYEFGSMGHENLALLNG